MNRKNRPVRKAAQTVLFIGNEFSGVGRQSADVVALLNELFLAVLDDDIGVREVDVPLGTLEFVLGVIGQIFDVMKRAIRFLRLIPELFRHLLSVVEIRPYKTAKINLRKSRGVPTGKGLPRNSTFVLQAFYPRFLDDL